MSSSSISDRPYRRAPVAVVAASLLGLAVLAAACGGSSTGTPSTDTPTAATALVKPPDLTLQGCTYEVDGKVPPGQPTAYPPHFKAFAPDQAAIDAVNHLKADGGTGLVYGFTLPSGASLYAGPDTGGGVVGTIPDTKALLAADPVLWTTSAGKQWLAFFVACGGNNLYWADVDALNRQNPGGEITATIANLKVAPPFDKTGKASALPIRIDDKHHIVWTNSSIPFVVGRGQLVSAQ